MMDQKIFESLIGIPKVITEPPKKNDVIQHQSRQNKLLVKSFDEQYLFEVYWRQHIVFFENFSVGIRWLPRDGTPPLTLMRCNGPHGEHRLHEHHVSSHVHFLDWDDADEGITIPKNVGLTSDYSTLEEALIYSLRSWNVQNFEPHFAFAMNTPPLF